MNTLNCILFYLAAFSTMHACTTRQTLKEEVLALKKEWGYKFPLPSSNDSINLIAIQMEKSYFTFRTNKMDSLANKILSIDSIFYMAFPTQAFNKWPFVLKKTKEAKKNSLNDTNVFKQFFGGDYSYWIEHDTVAAPQQYIEINKIYPDSKIDAWLAGRVSLWCKDYPKTIYYYNKSFEIDREFYHIYYDIGDTYLDCKLYKKSIENFKIFPRHIHENTEFILLSNVTILI